MSDLCGVEHFTVSFQIPYGLSMTTLQLSLDAMECTEMIRNEIEKEVKRMTGDKRGIGAVKRGETFKGESAKIKIAQGRGIG